MNRHLIVAAALVALVPGCKKDISSEERLDRETSSVGIDKSAGAEDIKKIAQKLPDLAQKDLKPEMLRDVNVKAKELAGMFTEIDEAADAGKKEETAKLHERMKALVSDLKKHAEGGAHDKH